MNRRRLGVVFVSALLFAGCDLLMTTPFPAFLGYTDMALDLSDEIEEVWSNQREIQYQLDVVYTGASDARVLLVVEPPTDDGGGYDYKGELFMFDEDLNPVATVTPLSDLDFFGRPFAYGHTGTTPDVILASTMMITKDGQLFNLSQTYEGLEGPAIADEANSRTYVFAPPPGDFATFDIQWQEYQGDTDLAPDPDTIWSPTQIPLGSFPIIPAAQQSSDSDAGYQILDAVYNSGSDNVTFLLSEPAAARVVAARVLLADVVAATVTSLAATAGAFPIEIDADRPLDAHADQNGFFLRRRDGLLERYNWTPSGPLRLVGGGTSLTGDRYFFRHYAFLSGTTASGNEYMYRFDPSSRILTRYTRWW